MAFLQRIAGRHVRNLETFSARLSPRHNVFYGHNASGKTSLLEAIYILGHARSFRARQLRQVIRHGGTELKVQGEVVQPDNDAHTPLSVHHENGRSQLQVNEQPLKRASELAQYLPLLFINTDSHNIIAGGPAQRRRLLDWGVFHVEHSYAALLSRYTTTLRQRNACLQDGRRSATPAHIWNKELAETAATIDERRRGYCEQWRPWAQHYIAGLLGREDIALAYRRGWRDEETFEETLARSADTDHQLGYTRHGPHRADIRITVDGLPVEQCVSRGQQKLLVFALAFAQAAVLRELRQRQCLVLIDDLAAELDQAHRARALDMLSELGGQSVLTVTEPQLLEARAGEELRMFHVEHGLLKEVV